MDMVILMCCVYGKWFNIMKLSIACVAFSLFLMLASKFLGLYDMYSMWLIWDMSVNVLVLRFVWGGLMRMVLKFLMWIVVLVAFLNFSRSKFLVTFSFGFKIILMFDIEFMFRFFCVVLIKMGFILIVIMCLYKFVSVYVWFALS